MSKQAVADAYNQFAFNLYNAIANEGRVVIILF